MKVSKASIVALTAGSVLLASTIVFATHKSTGEFTACYKKGKGTVRLIRENGLPNQCPEGFRQFKFAQEGPTGPPGPPGTQTPPPGGVGTAGLAATEARIVFEGVDGCDTNSNFGLGSHCSPNPSNGVVSAFEILFNPANYPATATYRLEGAIGAPANTEVCGRLFDYTADAPVGNSLVCFNNTDASQMWVFRQTGNLSLPAGNHFYSLQSRVDPPNSNGVVLLYLIIDW